MKSANSLSRLSTAASLGMLIGFGVLMAGQEVPLQKEASAPKPAQALNEVLRHNIGDWILQGQGIPEDWSHHHLVFSNPGTEEQALANGTHDHWLSIVNDPRYIMQQLKRGVGGTVPGAEGFAVAVEATGAQEPTGSPNAADAEEAIGNSPAAKARKQEITKDWSMGLDGVAASQTGTVSSNGATGSSTVTVGGQTLTASAPVAASATGTFTGNPTNGQTVTIGGSETLTASLSTAATASITVASSFCIAPGQGVDVDGTTFTTNATAGTATYSVSTSTSPATQSVTIGGVTYNFVTAFSGSSIQVLVPTGTWSTTKAEETARNLSVAINNSGTCGFTSGGVCTDNVATANPEVSSTNTSGSATQTLTSLCADNAMITNTGSSHVSVGNVTAASSAGTNSASGLTFALNTSGSTTTPASQTLTATNIESVVNGNATTSAILTATNPNTGVVTLTANTWGTGANSYTLTDTATSGVTLSGFSGGANGTNTGTSFAIDNVTADAATNLAAAITRNGGSVGVTATANGSIVTVTAATAGSSGNSTALAEGLSGFTWSGSDLGGGADGTTSGTTFAYWLGNAAVSPTQLATNIATAINDNTTLQASTGVTATSSGDMITVAARATGTSSIGTTASLTGFAWDGSTLTGGATGTGTVQPNTFPAKYGVSLTGASCSDFVIYPTGKAGSTTAASIVADTNLYTSGCTGAVPSVYWAYNTGGTVTTSPVLSEDGSQVAYIQSNGTTASLVLLKWAASTTETVGAPLTLTTQLSASAYRSCVAPCMYTLAFANTDDDTFSAPFDSYGDDTIYVGDDGGNLHQFTGVFNGSPAESGSPWPVHLGANKLSSPVYDTEDGFQGGYIFVGDRGGVFYSVGSGYGGTTAGQIHGDTGSLGDVIADAPLVDSSEGTEFVFVTTNGSYSETGDNAVWEFVSSFTTLGTPGVVPVGIGGTGYYLYAGDFDNVYYESGNPAYGHLYVAGNTGTAGGGALYQVEIAYSSLTGTVTAVATGLNSTEHPWPSPVTEFCNDGTSGCAITQQRNVTGKVSTTSPEITLSSGTFTSADVGAVVSGTDIPFGDTISSVLSSTTANLSAVPTTGVSSETLAIQGGQTTSGTDYVFFSVNRSTRSGCTNSAGDGCVLSYNVSNPTAVAISGSGLNVTTPGTNGCWATGGLIIDNSDTTTTGASQIYFVNLNGNAAGGPTGTTQTSSNCTAGPGQPIDATQASQSSP